jgi:hypothetical protein
MTAEERLESFNGDEPPNHSAVSLPPDFQLPGGWDYADDQIATWYAEWEKSPSVEVSVPRNNSFAFGGH